MCQRKRLINYTKIGDAVVPWHGSFNPFNVAVVDSARDPRRGDMMNKGGGSPYDAKCNVAEIGAVNMGEIGAVRKRSR